MATTSSPAIAPLRQADRLLGATLHATRAVLAAEHCAFVAERASDEREDRATDDGFLGRAREHVRDATSEPTIESRPVATHAGRYGTLVVEWADGESAVEHAPPLDGLAAQLAHLLAGLTQAEPTSQAYEALFRIGTRLHGVSGDLDAVLQLIVDEAAALLDTDLAWLCLVSEDGVMLAPAVVHGFRDPAFLELSIEVGRGVGGVAIAEHRAIIIGDYRSHVHDTLDEVRRAVVGEGVISLICAPMFKDDRMVGALYVANRATTAFADVDAALLSALAAQASVAIENRRLYERLSSQNDLLERAFEVHRELTQASLDGVGLAGIGDVLARLIGHPIVIEQDICNPPLLRCAPDGDAPGGDAPSIARAIAADGRRLGSIELLGTRSLTPLQLKALEHGTTVLALELVKQRSAAEVEWRLSGELLEELLEHSGSVPSEALARRARHLGVDIAQPHRILALAVDDDPSESHLLLSTTRKLMLGYAPHNASRALSVKRGRQVLLALPPSLEGEAAAIAQQVQAAMAANRVTASVGIGPLRRDFGETYCGASACLALATNAGGRGMIVELDALGPLRFLLDAGDVRQATAMIRETLDPVLANDAAGRAPLLPTLRAFVECDGHYQRTADQLYIAVSTLKYRLRKLREVLGAPPSDPELRFRLRLAFSLLDLIESMGVDGGLTPSVRGS